VRKIASTRALVTEGKKFRRSSFKTTSRLTCGAVKDLIERPLRNPCAASCGGIALITFSNKNRWIAFSRGLGASISRAEPSRFTIQ
jgi:hypothetical protein